MLSWDDYHKEEAAPSSAANAINAAAALSANAPTDVLLSEVQHDVQAVAAAAKAAEAAVDHLDVAPGLEALEMGAARVSVDEKAMINCRAAGGSADRHSGRRSSSEGC